MALHLIKLCVGCDSVEELQDWIRERLREKRQRGEPREHVHTTRMFPKQAADLVPSGSLYWVIRGEIACRQQLRALRAVVGADAIQRCQIVLNPKVVRVEPRSRRPFQGWRYLPSDEAPPDLGGRRAGALTLPEPMRRELRELGLL